MTNTQVLARFYNAFQQLDYATMQDCYAPEVVFQDPVFGLLQGDEARAMWAMLCKNARDFSLVFTDIVAEDQEYVTCRWEARYMFSATGRPVVNRIRAYLRVQDGRITEHTDSFSFWRWAGQAMGWTGWLLGWSTYYRSQVRKQARNNLAKFMQRK